MKDHVKVVVLKNPEVIDEQLVFEGALVDGQYLAFDNHTYYLDDDYEVSGHEDEEAPYDGWYCREVGENTIVIMSERMSRELEAEENNEITIAVRDIENSESWESFARLLALFLKQQLNKDEECDERIVGAVYAVIDKVYSLQMIAGSVESKVE